MYQTKHQKHCPEGSAVPARYCIIVSQFQGPQTHQPCQQ